MIGTHRISRESMADGWVNLDSEALFQHIAAEGGIEIPFTSCNQGPVLIDAMAKRLNGHFHDVEVVFSIHPTDPNTFLARFALPEANVEISPVTE